MSRADENLTGSRARVGAFEAKTKFSELLDRVQAGEEIVITRNGQEVAKLVPIGNEVSPEVAERRRRAVEELKEICKGQTLGGLNWRELRDEGRKY